MPLPLLQILGKSQRQTSMERNVEGPNIRVLNINRKKKEAHLKKKKSYLLKEVENIAYPQGNVIPLQKSALMEVTSYRMSSIFLEKNF